GRGRVRGCARRTGWVAQFCGVMENNCINMKILETAPLEPTTQKVETETGGPAPGSFLGGGNNTEDTILKEEFPEGLEPFFCPELPADGRGVRACGEGNVGARD
ncbi:unnamed protein product, partial [Choristocarpus tenellus]